MEERSMMRQVRARVSNLHGWSRNNAKGRTERIDKEVARYLLQNNQRHTVAQKDRRLKAVSYIEINRIQTPSDVHNKVDGLNTGTIVSAKPSRARKLSNPMSMSDPPRSAMDWMSGAEITSSAPFMGIPIHLCTFMTTMAMTLVSYAFPAVRRGM